MGRRRNKAISNDPLTSPSHGKPTAMWCLANFATPAEIVALGHQHVCNVDIYRANEHTHRCGCGEVDRA